MNISSAFKRNKAYEYLHLDVVTLVKAADELLGKGTIVDATAGTTRKVKPLQTFTTVQALVHSLESCQASLREVIRKDPHSAELHDLLATITALQTFALAVHDGHDSHFLDTLKKIYSTRISLVSQSRISKLKEQLRRTLARLGFVGKWPTPLVEWRKRAETDVHSYFRLLNQYTEQFRRVTFDGVLNKMVGFEISRELRRRAKVEIKLVDASASWSAYHYYCGGFASKIEIAKSSTFNRYDAAVFAAHEIYPGHHTQALLFEHFLNQDIIGLLYGLTLLNTPGSMLAEGIAVLSLNILDVKDANIEVAYLSDCLRFEVRHNAAIRRIMTGGSLDAFCDDICKAVGCDMESAQKSLRFAEEWKYYFPIYSKGLDVAEEYYSKYGNNGLASLYLSHSLAGCNRRCAALMK